MADQLSFWDEGGGVLADDFFTLGTSGADRKFRVRNDSMHLSAVGVTVSLAGDGAPHLLLSRDGLRFTAGVGLGTLPPLGLSAALTLRRALPPGLVEGALSFQVTASPTSWASI